MSAMTNRLSNPKRQKRVSRACDNCHRRSVRCVVPEDARDRRCQNCVDFDQLCTYNREARRRGAKPRSAIITETASPETPNSAGGTQSARSPPSTLPKSTNWVAIPVANQAVVMDMVEIYFEVVYPIFPYFHRPSFLRKIARGEYTTDKFLFAATMAICALVSGRIKDGALFNPQWDTVPLLETPSEVFYNAAITECRNFTPADASNLNLLRASALLSIASIQASNPAEMQMHLGRYHTLSAISSFHDETQWPKDVGVIETEERRRLFWSLYTLELFTSIVWNGVSRCREQQCNVSYPTELDDEQFDDTGYRTTAESPLVIGPSPTHSGGYLERKHWLAGWNFTTDLYRVLEHVITHFRDRRRGRVSFLTDILGDSPSLSGASVRDSIMAMYARLPSCFKGTPPITCNMSLDRYGFQAANIIATIQLLRMVLFTSTGSTVEERCQIASEVVDAFMRIPVAYLQAISSPLLHHLTGIGAILGSALEEPLNQTEYQSIRTVLLSLAQLLENLDHGMHSTKNVKKLRLLVARIDEYMEIRLNLIANRSRDRSLQPATQIRRQTSNLSAGRLDVQHESETITSPVTNRLSDCGEIGRVFTNTPFQLPAELLDDWPWFVEFPLQESRDS